MKIFYNDQILNLKIPLYISGFTLKTLICEEIGISKNSESILKSQGKIINDNDIINKNQEYQFILKKLGGGNLINPENSTPIMIIISLVFGLISIIYFNLYKFLNLQFNSDGGENIRNFLNKYTKDVPTIPKFDCNQDTKDMGFFKKFIYKFRRFFHCNETWLKFVKGVKTFFYYTIGVPFKSMNDKDFQKSTCGANVFFTTDVKYLKKTDSSLPNVLTTGLFFTYMYIVLLPMLCNFFTTFYCGSPGFRNFGISFLFFIIPLLISIFIPYIVKFFNFIISLFSDFRLTDYKIAFSNFALLFFGIIFLISTAGSLTPMFYGFIILVFIIFALLKFKFSGVGLSSVISNCATFLSNLVFLEDDQYNKVPYEDPENPLQNKGNASSEPSPECFMRYRVIYDLLETGYTLLFSFILCLSVFYPQINKHCGKK